MLNQAYKLLELLARHFTFHFSPEELLCLILIFGAFSASLLTCFKKWRWIEYYEVYRFPWMPSECEFCFSFWLSLLQALIYVLFTGHLVAFLAAFAAASITKKLLQ